MVSGSAGGSSRADAPSTGGEAVRRGRCRSTGGSLSPAGKPQRGKQQWQRPWTDEQKRLLMDLAGNKGVDFRIARKVRRSIADCQTMYDILREHASLRTKAVTVIENGHRVTKCPPAYARGAYPGKSVGSSGRS